MKITLNRNNKSYTADLSKPIDISLPVTDLTRAWYIAPPSFEPVKMGDTWIGSVELGGTVNFYDVTFNPHAHGTHTECLGHVTKERESVNQALQGSWFVAELISVNPINAKGDEVITATEVNKKWRHPDVDAVIIRTLPNDAEKAHKNMSSTNWPYLDRAAGEFLAERGIKHLLIDQPSVDREEDNGALAAHKAFWRIPDAPRKNATITELVFIPDEVADGLYLLNLQVAPLENDASPSRPLLFHMDEEMMV